MLLVFVTCTCIVTKSHTHTHTCMHTHKCTCMHTHCRHVTHETLTLVHKHTCTYMYCVHTNKHAHTHTHTHTHSHTHTHTHTRADGVPKTDSLQPFLRQARGLPRSHAAAGREARRPSPHHQLHEEVRHHKICSTLKYFVCMYGCISCCASCPCQAVEFKVDSSVHVQNRM